MKVAKRGNIPAFLIMEALREANRYAEETGKDMIHLSLGQPGKEAPQAVLNKVAERLTSAPLGYTEAAGIMPLRRRIVQHYKEMYDLDIPVERIFVTAGSSSAYFLSLLAAFDATDRVAIPQPCYPAYPNMMEAMDLVPVFLRTGRRTHFQPTVEMLDALPERPHGLVVASPSNPAGTILRRKEMQALAEHCEAHGIRMISDEIYHGVAYVDEHEVSSVLEHTDTAIVVNSFSKYFLMPGWRLGWAVVPPDLVRAFESLAQNFFISPSAIAQYAALEAFDCKEELQAVVKEYEVNRKIMLDALPAAGFDDLAPVEGAFYVYANVSKLTNDSEQFCRRMMQETGVVTVPGHDFDRENGKAYIRFSFSGSEKDVTEAMRRLKDWLSNHQGVQSSHG